MKPKKENKILNIKYIHNNDLNYGRRILELDFFRNF